MKYIPSFKTLPHAARLALLGFAFLIGFTNCGAPPSAPETDSLVFAHGSDAVNLDPGSMEDGYSANIAQQMFEGLVKFKNGSLEIEPALAERWETSGDGREWTFYLRPGVKFHDGTTLTSEAIVLSLMRLLDENHPYHLAGRMPYADMALRGIVKEVVADGDMTVRVILYEPYAPLLKNLAMFCCFISSPAALKKYGEEYSVHPVGTGPLRFVKWTRDVEVVLARYDEYWGAPAKTQQVIYKVLRDPEVRLFSVARGEASIMVGINPQTAAEVKKNPNLTLLEQPGVNISFAYMNVEKGPLIDKRVRQAINYAVNKKAICDHLFEGYAEPMRGIFPPSVLGHDPDSRAYEFDPDKAKALLVEAGYSDGFDIEIMTYSVPRPYNPIGARLAEVVQNDLSEIGVRVKISQVEWGTLLQRSLNHDFEICMLGWSTDNGDPDNFAYALLANPENRSQFKHEEFNRLVRLGQQTYDENERLKIYQQAQTIALDEAPWLFLNTTKDFAALRQNIKGFVLHPMALHYLWPVSIEN
ncbi:MAG: ABC transporter substrate-binding protein [Candidatus Hinthialibacter antarcticus]|nr:ABC transporter substrate-binding protein [Candidatus Hinthialibacter antarcticus]